MSTEELLRYDREWEAMRQALGAWRLVFAFPHAGDKAQAPHPTTMPRDGFARPASSARDGKISTRA